MSVRGIARPGADSSHGTHRSRWAAWRLNAAPLCHVDLLDVVLAHSFDQSVTDMGMAGVVDMSEFMRIRSGGEALERMMWH